MTWTWKKGEYMLAKIEKNFENCKKPFRWWQMVNEMRDWCQNSCDAPIFAERRVCYVRESREYKFIFSCVNLWTSLRRDLPPVVYVTREVILPLSENLKTRLLFENFCGKRDHATLCSEVLCGSNNSCDIIIETQSGKTLYIFDFCSCRTNRHF